MWRPRKIPRADFNLVDAQLLVQAKCTREVLIIETITNESNLHDGTLSIARRMATFLSEIGYTCRDELICLDAHIIA